nr:MAG TPA: Melanocortin-2 receptor accessory protein family [Crassvirales sp.]
MGRRKLISILFDFWVMLAAVIEKLLLFFLLKGLKDNIQS